MSGLFKSLGLIASKIALKGITEISQELEKHKTVKTKEHTTTNKTVEAELEWLKQQSDRLEKFQSKALQKKEVNQEVRQIVIQSLSED